MKPFDLRAFLRDRSRSLREKMEHLDGLIEEARAGGEYLHFRTVESPALPRVRARDLRTGGGAAEKIQMASNNYLGLTHHPRCIEAAREAVAEWGVGAGGPCTIQGWTTRLQEFEQALADYKGCEAAIVSPSGYSANIGTITALVGPGDSFICDELDHASIIDGGRYSGANFYVYRHDDVDDLRRVLEELKDHPGTKLLATCGVFSMDGDVAPLDRIVPLAREYDVMLMVDDAHGSGVVGPTGKGSPELRGVHGEVEIVMGTFSKAFGGYGGFVAGSKPLVNYLRHFARATMFSAAVAPMNIAAMHAALRVMQEEPGHLARLRENVEFMREGLADAGYDVGRSESAITPIMIRDAARCHALVREAYDEGLFLSMIEYPAVAVGTERIRLTCMANHTREDLETALEILVRLGRKHGVLEA